MRAYATFSIGLLGLLAIESPAWADELVYRAPPQCPSREEAIARLGARAPAEVTIARRQPTGFTADAVFSDGKANVARHLEGETCEGVLDALALVLALGAPDVPPPVPTEPPTPNVTVSASSERRGATERPDERSAVELAIGLESGFRGLASELLLGGAIYAEIAAPMLGNASWYRPSAQLAVGYWGNGWYDTPRQSLDFNAEVVVLRSTSISLVGGRLDLCPVGAAAVSKRYFELTLASCGRVDVGSAERTSAGLWIDGGVLERVSMQFGRKGRYRGFVAVDLGLLWRLGDPLDTTTASIEAAQTVRILYPRDTGAQPAFALGGGIVFP